MHYFDMSHWLLCLIGSCLHKYKPAEEGWVDSKTTFPIREQKPATNKRCDRLFVCFHDSPLVGGNMSSGWIGRSVISVMVLLESIAWMGT